MVKNSLSNPDLSCLCVGPAQYVSRERIIEDSGGYVLPWGDRAFISGGRRALASAEEQLIKSLDRAGISGGKDLFIGECCPENIAKIKDKVKHLRANVIIGVGGGKSLDAAKVAAAELDIPVVCIPTIAATCAASTALAILYNQKGIFEKSMSLPKNPSLVLVDPGIIANAPVIYLESGILDSMAKWFEGCAVYKGMKNPDIYTQAAFQLSEFLYKSFQQQSIEAVSLVRQQKVGNALVQVIDLILLLTGIIQSLVKTNPFFGIAHAVHNGMTVLEESHQLLHGTKVGYGILVQMCVEEYPKQEFDEILSFFKQLDLKPSLKGLNLPYTRDIILKIAEKAANDPSMGPITYPINKEIIASAMEDLERRFDHS